MRSLLLNQLTLLLGEYDDSAGLIVGRDVVEGKTRGSKQPVHIREEIHVDPAGQTVQLQLVPCRIVLKGDDDLVIVPPRAIDPALGYLLLRTEGAARDASQGLDEIDVEVLACGHVGLVVVPPDAVRVERQEHEVSTAGTEILVLEPLALVSVEPLRVQLLQPAHQFVIAQPP